MASPIFPWLEHRPKNWEVVRLKGLFCEHKNKNHGLIETNLLSLSYGQIVQRDINQRGGLLPESFEGYNIVEPNDIVLRLTDLQNDQKSLRTGLVRERGIITSAYVTLRQRSRVNATYFEALLKSYDFRKVFYSMGGGVRQSLTFGDVSSLPLLVPTGEEQAAIVDFLSHKTAEIDGLVGKMSRQVELLERYRRELIARTVTRGLDPDVPMKDSGIDWIGEVPMAWEIKRAKSLFFQRKEKSTETDVHLTPSQIYGVLPQEEYMQLSGTKPVLNLSAPNNMKHVELGDFIIHLRSFQGGIELSNYAGKVSNAYTVFSARQGGDNNYYRWLLKSSPFIAKLSSLTDQLRDGQSINFKTFSHMVFPLPPISEQRRIADFLNKKSSEIDSTVAGINKQIELLGRYRKQVINDLVTGKVRVGEVA